MDPFGDDDIAQLLRLKRYEQPPASYYENFLSEFRRRQRDELLRQPVWRICFERAHGFALRHNVRPYPAGVAVVVACAAVISIRIYQQPEHVQVAVESSACSKRATSKCRKRIGLRASGVHSDFRHAADSSPRKKRCSGAARRLTTLRSVCPPQARTGITRRSVTAREIKVRLRKLTARVCVNVG
jgi:hypothetical protein